MITYTTGQRRSLRFDGSDWQEEVLTASGVAVDDSIFQAVSGANAYDMFDSIDNVLDGLTATPASGIVLIDEVSNVSGTVGGTLGEFDTLILASGSNSIFRFSFTVPAQPVDPVHIRVFFSPLASGTGTFSGTLSYNLFEQGDNLVPGAFTYSGSASQSIVPADYQDLKLLNFTIPLVDFSSGTAPFTVACQIARDTGVGGNFPGNIAVVSLYADNIPGGATGNQAGYVGGNLVVTGDLTVQGTTVLQGGVTPASGTDTGISGSVVISDDFVYFATGTNAWKRTSISNF